MARVPRIAGNKVVAAFKKAGFEVLRTSSSHQILGKDGCKYRLSIPLHGNKPVGVGLLSDQIKLAGLTVEQFIEYL